MIKKANLSQKRSAGVGRVAVPLPSKAADPVPRTIAGSVGAAESRERSVALSLLKYFYWIELGIRSYLRSRNNIEFSRAEGLVISSIMLGYHRPSDISRQLGVSRQAIHVTIQQMRKKGMVQLKPDPHDRRIKQVVLTELAKQMNDDGIVAMNLLWKELDRKSTRLNSSHSEISRMPSSA